jgi:hypothetical protein
MLRVSFSLKMAANYIRKSYKKSLGNFSMILNDTGRVTFFFILVCEAIDTAATPGLLCRPRVLVKMIVEKQMECRLAGETEVLGETLPQRHFCASQNPS